MNVWELSLRPHLKIRDLSSRTAVNNARRAVEQLRREVGDRRRLVAGLLPSAPPTAAEHELKTDADLPRPGLVSLSTDECLRLLAEREFGRLAFNNRQGQPLILPVNYLLDGTDILITSGPGPKLQAAERREQVALEVDDINQTTHQGWSILITGRAERDSYPSRAKLRPSTWAPGPRSQLIRVRVDRISGRRLRQG